MFNVRHPQLEKLFKLNDRVISQFAGTDTVYLGLGEIGLILPDTIHELENGDYWCTPINSLAFAHTGGDGHHYSLVAYDGRIDEDSPVILTRPDYSDYTSNVVVGKNLQDFLCLGRHTGFFNFLYRGFDDSFHAGGQFAEELRETQCNKLDLLANEFALTPWSADSGAKFGRLQEITGQLQLRPESDW